MSATETEGGRASATGNRICCKDRGEGQPVVFSHGWPPNAALRCSSQGEAYRPWRGRGWSF